MKRIALTIIVALMPAAVLAGGGGEAAPDGVASELYFIARFVLHSLGLL